MGNPDPPRLGPWARTPGDDGAWFRMPPAAPALTAAQIVNGWIAHRVAVCRTPDDAERSDLVQRIAAILDPLREQLDAQARRAAQAEQERDEARRDAFDMAQAGIASEAAVGRLRAALIAACYFGHEDGCGGKRKDNLRCSSCQWLPYLDAPAPEPAPPRAGGVGAVVEAARAHRVAMEAYDDMDDACRDLDRAVMALDEAPARAD